MDVDAIAQTWDSRAAPVHSLLVTESKQINLKLHLKHNREERKLADSTQATWFIHKYLKEFMRLYVHSLSSSLLTYSFKGSMQGLENRKKYAPAAVGQKFLSIAWVASIFSKVHQRSAAA